MNNLDAGVRDTLGQIHAIVYRPLSKPVWQAVWGGTRASIGPVIAVQQAIRDQIGAGDE